MNNRSYLKIFFLVLTVLFTFNGCSHLQKNDVWKGYSLTWLGTAGWKVSYKGKTVLIDPYFSRSSVKDKSGKEDDNRIWESDLTAIFWLTLVQPQNVSMSPIEALLYYLT